MISETSTSMNQMSLDGIVGEAIRRENLLMEFYKNAISEVGPDARLLMAHLYTQHVERIAQLRNLLKEIEELRDLSVAMAD